MSSRADIARGKSTWKTHNKNTTDPDTEQSPTSTLVLPSARRICSILLFFIGSFAVGFGAGFATGFASKECH